MSRQIAPSTREINRLRAAAALIPIIEVGLIDAKLSAKRAALMASYCEWSTEKLSDDPEAVRLAETVLTGMKRLNSVLSSLA